MSSKLKNELIHKCYEIALRLRLQRKNQFYPEDLAEKFQYYYGEALAFEQFGFEDVGKFLESSNLFLRATGNDGDRRLRALLTENYVFKHTLKTDPSVTPAVVDLSAQDREDDVQEGAPAIRVKREPVEEDEPAEHNKFNPRPVLQVKVEVVQPEEPQPVATVASVPQKSEGGQQHQMNGEQLGATVPQPKNGTAPPAVSSGEPKPTNTEIDQGTVHGVLPPPPVAHRAPSPQAPASPPSSPDYKPPNDGVDQEVFDPRRVIPQPSIVRQQGDQLYVTPPGLIQCPQLSDRQEKQKAPPEASHIPADPVVDEKTEPLPESRSAINLMQQIEVSKNQQTVVDRTIRCLRDAGGTLGLDLLNRDYMRMYGMSFKNAFNQVCDKYFSYISVLSRGEIQCKKVSDRGHGLWLLQIKDVSSESDAMTDDKPDSTSASPSFSSNQSAATTLSTEFPPTGPNVLNQPIVSIPAPPSHPHQFRVPDSRLPPTFAPLAGANRPQPVPPPSAAGCFIPFVRNAGPQVPPPSHFPVQPGFAPFNLGFRPTRAVSVMPNMHFGRHANAPTGFVPNQTYGNRLVAGMDPSQSIGGIPTRPPSATSENIDIMGRVMQCLTRSNDFRLDQRALWEAYRDRYTTDFNVDATRIYKTNNPNFLMKMFSEKIEMYRDGGRWIYRLRSAFRPRPDDDGERDLGPVRFPHNPVRRAVTRMPQRHNRTLDDDRSRCSVDRSFGRGRSRSPPRRDYSPKRYRRE